MGYVDFCGRGRGVFFWGWVGLGVFGDWGVCVDFGVCVRSGARPVFLYKHLWGEDDLGA